MIPLVLRHLLAAICTPLPTAALLLVTGALAALTPRKVLSRVLLATGGVVGIGASVGPVANALLRPLEARYPAATSLSALPATARYVIVLGSGYAPEPDRPITAALEPAGVVRVAEGIRILRQLPGATLVLSGGAVGGHPPSAYGYALMANALGVPNASLRIIDTPTSTAEEIDTLRKLAGDSPVIIVTSAAHMPRVMLHCARLGLRAAPAPTGHLAGPIEIANALSWLPSAKHLQMSESAIHEYLGLLALRLGLS